MSPRVRTRRQGSSGYITRGTAEVRVGGGSGRVAGLCPVITCHYVKNIGYSTNYFIPEIRDPDIERVCQMGVTF